MIKKSNVILAIDIIILVIVVTFCIYSYINIEHIKVLADPCGFCEAKTGASCLRIP